MKAFNKKTLVGVMVMCAMSTMVATSPVTAYTGTPSIIIDGSSIHSDTDPYIVNGTTLVPLRTISENMGASVEWDEATKGIHIEKDDRTVDLTVGSTTAYINGNATTVTLAPEISNNRTMVPLRFIGEALQCDVDWDGTTKTVTITTGTTQATDQFGRKIKTTNLPSNYADFPYIAEGVPNWCYEIQPTVRKNVYFGADTIADGVSRGKSATDSLAIILNSGDTTLITQDTYNTVQKFVNLQTNIDYNTIDESWVEGMLSCFADNQMEVLAAEWVGDECETVKEHLEAYLAAYKAHKQVTSCEAQVLPETIWLDVYGYPHIAVYTKYTLNSLIETSDPIYNINYGASYASAPNMSQFEIGKTYETVVTYKLIQDSKGNWKINWEDCDVDGQINPSVDFTDGVNPSNKDTNRCNDYDYTWTNTVVNRYSGSIPESQRDLTNCTDPISIQ